MIISCNVAPRFHTASVGSRSLQTAGSGPQPMRRLATLGRRLLRLLPLELQIKPLAVPSMDHGGNVLERLNR